jgi:hypothetical protein
MGLIILAMPSLIAEWQKKQKTDKNGPKTGPMTSDV